IRAYPQGTGSGDEGILATAELRFYTPVKGLVFSTYYDTGFVKYNHGGELYMTRDGAVGSSIHLQGWGVGLSYTAPGDWFARLDYARRIGGSRMLTEEEKAKGRLWFMAGKIW
ncbi:MAG: ShlB/FhaC/HecB family hemolysin secretion/activation protein, partial [Selenomonas sp.]|nr:ShlB/FhaC/HecB family hemolysin secretion/activation protein [Selenomonas sp.]